MTTDNRTNEPTEEQVEAAAKAIADCHNPGMFEKYPENWRVEARAALAAAAGAVPVQPSSTVDEDALAEVIRRSYENEQGLKIRDDKRTARAVAEWLRGESR